VVGLGEDGRGVVALEAQVRLGDVEEGRIWGLVGLVALEALAGGDGAMDPVGGFVAEIGGVALGADFGADGDGLVGALGGVALEAEAVLIGLMEER
jgi:hypothetical protein